MNLLIQREKVEVGREHVVISPNVGWGGLSVRVDVVFAPEVIQRFIESQAFSRLYDLAPQPPSSPLSRQGSLIKRHNNLLTGEERKPGPL
jgi:hypothetical protein